MKPLVLVLTVMLLTGCTARVPPKTLETAVQACPGDTVLPDELKDSFAPVADPALLAKAMGQPEKGKLCQAQVYESRPDTRVILFRAWNSSNPGSRLGS